MFARCIIIIVLCVITILIIIIILLYSQIDMHNVSFMQLRNNNNLKYSVL